MGFENGKLLRVVLRATVGGDQQVNTLHYDLIDPPLQDPNDPQSLADTFRDDVIPQFAALYNSAWQIEPVEVVEEFDPQNPLAPRASWTSGAATPGTNGVSSTQMPRACVAIATLKTDAIGRRHTGRMFLGGTTHESDQNAGLWVGAGIVAAWATLLGAIPRQPDISGAGSAATANWCVYSRTSRAANVDPYASHVQAVIQRSAVKWLRSREE